ncbi:MAG: hypothetical protein RJA07_2503 [Bacteroidota bacterium]|jgi:hypothetical protein
MKSFYKLLFVFALISIHPKFSYSQNFISSPTNDEMANATLSHDMPSAGEDDEDDAPRKKKTKQTKRVEFEAKFGSNQYIVVPIGEEGILMFGESDERSKDGKKNWIFTKYNTSLKESWSGEYGVSKQVDFVKHYYDKERGYVYILLSKSKSMFKRNANQVNLITEETEIVKFNVKKNTLSSTTGNLPLRTTVTDFVVKNGIAYFGGNTVVSMGTVCLKQCLIVGLCYVPICFGAAHLPYHPTLFTADIKQKEFKISPLNYEGDASVVNISRGSNESAEVSVAIRNYPDKKTNNMFVQNYENGKPTNTYKLKSKAKNEFVTASIYKLGDKDDLVFGTYAPPYEDKSFFQKMFAGMSTGVPSNVSVGFYLSRFVDGKQNYLKVFPFNKYFKVVHYGGLFSSPKQKVEESGTDKKGKERPVSLSLLMHDVIKRSDNEYILIADAYYAHYHTETYYDGKNWQTRQVFDGYVFTDAIIMSFDPEKGELNWYETFDINSWPPTMNLRPRVKVIQNENESDIVFVYNDGKSINTKVLHDGKISDGQQTSMNLNTGKETDKVTNTYDGGDVEYWYDNYFIAYGYQRIKTKGKLIGGRRTVFYFNKIGYKS